MVDKVKPDKIISLTLRPSKMVYEINHTKLITKYGVFESELVPDLWVGSYSMADKIRKHIFDLSINVKEVPDTEYNFYIEPIKNFSIDMILSNWFYGDIRKARYVDIKIGDIEFALEVTSHQCYMYKKNAANAMAISVDSEDLGFKGITGKLFDLFMSCEAHKDETIDMSITFKF